jgi:hypothetical protein
MMIPDRLPSAASVGEKRVFSLLQKLPDDCLVYYEPIIENRYPDFVIVMPEVGVLVIEVKGWYPAEVEYASTHEVRTRIRGLVATSPHPLRQARHYMFRLMDKARNLASRYAEAAGLLHSAGDQVGKFRFPFGSLACLSNISREQLAGTSTGDLSPVFAAPRTMARDELFSLEDASSAKLLARLKECFDPWWPFGALTPEQVQMLRAIIHPEIIVGGESKRTAHSSASAIANKDMPLKILDPIQEANARSIGEGHRVIYGVAGSGKTVLLVARAKLLAQNPSKRILVLCFNRALAGYLRRTLDPYSNVTAIHFHGWGTANGVTFRKNEGEEAYGMRILQRLEDGSSDGRSFDAVLVDEAQDFEKSWLKCAKTALKEPDDGDLVIVGDGAQMLYSRSTFTWRDAGIHAIGRTIVNRFDLERNYRNTREILQAALPFAAQSPGGAEHSSRTSMLLTADTARRSGIKPIILPAASRKNECTQIVDLVGTWLTHGVPTLDGRPAPISANEIEILYPRLPSALTATMHDFVAGLSNVAPTFWWKRDENEDGVDTSITVRTMHSAKGLQRRAVIIMWSDLLPMTQEPDQTLRDRGLFYVALTRAEDVLVVSRSGPSAFIDQLEQAIAA